MECALSTALIVEKVWLIAAKHDVARLEIAIQKIITIGTQQKISKDTEIIFESLLAEGNSGKSQEVVFEIIQVPGNRLSIETLARVADFEIQIASGLDLEAWQRGDRLAIGVDNFRGNSVTATVLRKILKQGQVTEVLFEVGAFIQV